MATLNLKFMYANVLCAAQVKIPVNTLFSDKVAKSVEFWTKSLRMESLAAAIALLNIAGTTLQYLGCSLATLSLLENSSLFIHQRSGENPKDHGSVPPGYSNGVDLETRIGIYRENESEHMCMTSCM